MSNRQLQYDRLVALAVAPLRFIVYELITCCHE